MAQRLRLSPPRTRSSQLLTGWFFFAPFPWEIARRTRPNYVAVQFNGIILPFLSLALLHPKTLVPHRFNFPILTPSARRNHVDLAEPSMTITSTWQSPHPGRLGCHCQLTSSLALSRVDVRELRWHVVASVFNQPEPLLASELAHSLTSTHASCVGTLWPPFSTNRTPLLASSLAGSLVSAHTSCVGTSWPPVLDSDLSDATSRQLNNLLAHSLVPTASCRHSQPCVPGLQSDGCYRSPVCQFTGSLACRRALFFALHARHASLCWLPPRTH